MVLFGSSSSPRRMQRDEANDQPDDRENKIEIEVEAEVAGQHR